MVLLSRQLAIATVTGFALACLCSPVFAADGVIRGVQYDSASRHFVIDATGPVKAIVNTLTIAGHKRIIVDVDNAEIGYELPKDAMLLQALSRSLPSLRNVTVNQYGGNGRPIVRILLDIDGDLKTIRLVRNQGPKLELEVNDSAVVANPYPQPTAPTSRPAAQPVYEMPAQRTTSQATAPAASPAVSMDTAGGVSRAKYDEAMWALEEQRRQNQSLQQQVARLNAQVAETGDSPSLADMKNTLAVMNRKYEALVQENQYLKARSVTSAESATADSQALARLKAETDRLRVSNANLQSQLNNMLSTPQDSSATVELQNQLNTLRQRADSLQRENQSLRSQLAVQSQPDPMLRDELDGLKNQVATLNRDNQGLRTQLSNRPTADTSALTAKQDEINRLQSQIGSLTRENQALKNQNLGRQQNDSLLASRQLELDRLTRENQGLREQMRQASGSGAGLEAMKQTLVNMNRKYDTLAAENQRLTAEAQRLRSQLTTTSASDYDLQELRRQLGTAQGSLNESIRTINEQNKELAYLRNQVAQVKAGMDAENSQQLARLESEKRAQEDRIRELERQLAIKSTGTQTASASQAELARLKQQLSQTSAQYKTSVDDLNRQLQAKSRQLQTLDAELAANQEATRQAESLKRQVADLQAKLSGKSQAGQPVSAELHKRDLQIAALQQDISRLRTQNAQSSQGGTRLSSENESYKREIASLKAELEKARQKGSAPAANSGNPAEVIALKDELARMTRENFSLKENVEALKTQQQSASGTATSEAQAAELRQQLASLQSQYDQAREENRKALQELDVAHKTIAARPGTAASGSASNPSGASTAALQKQVADLNRQLADARREAELLRKRPAATPVASGVSQVARKNSVNPEAEKDYADAKAAMDAKDLKTALDKYKEALLLDQDNSQFAIDYSIALAEDQQHAEGIDVLRRYLQRNPNDREAYNQLGKLYLLNDQTDAASQAFSRAISVSTLNNYATSLKKLGRMDDSESIFRLALKLNPNDSEVLFNLGNLYNAGNKLELARNNYLQAIQFKPDFAEAHYNLGLVYSKLGNRQEAVNHLEKFLQLSPNARNAETIRAYVQKLKV